MSKYLIKSVEQWRVDSEAEAKALIEEAKKEKTSILSKYSSEYKERKLKGEVIDSWYRVTLNKAFQDEKEPDSIVTIDYSKEFDGSFPVNYSDNEEYEEEEE